MKSAGYGFDAGPMPFLFKEALTSQTLQLNTSKALKLCLALYYHIEPAQTPPTPLYEKIDTLFILQSLLDTKLTQCECASPSSRATATLDRCSQSPGHLSPQGKGCLRHSHMFWG